MTNLLECSLSKGLQLGLWCLTIQCLLSLPGISAECSGNTMKIYPEGLLISALYGKPLEVFCVDEGYTADDIEFIIPESSPFYSILPSERVNHTTRRVYVEKPEIGMYNYYCLNSRTRKYCNTIAVVDTPPQNVMDFHCKSKNMEELTCSWTPPYQVLSTHFSLVTTVNGRRVDYCVPKYHDRWQAYCSWREPQYRRFENQFVFILRSSNNVFGKNEQNFTIDHFSVVQPAPVKIFDVRNISSHSVLLEWSIPYNMVYILPNGVDHKIEYQIVNRGNSSHFRSVDTSSLPKKGQTFNTFLLSDLPNANSQYELKISIRPLEATGHEFWSEPSNVVFHTAAEELVFQPGTN